MRLTNPVVLACAASALAFTVGHAQAQVWQSTGGPEGGAVVQILSVGDGLVAVSKGAVYQRGAQESVWSRRVEIGDLIVYSAGAAEGQAFVGLSNGVVLHSADGGVNWTQHPGPRAPSQIIFQNARILDIDATGATWWATVPELPLNGFSSLFRTDNQGATWQPVAAPDQFTGPLLAAPDELVGIVRQFGFYLTVVRSTDGGDHWTVIGGGSEQVGGLDGSFTESDVTPRRIGSRLFVGPWLTENNGASWRRLVNAQQQAMPPVAAVGGTFFAVTAGREVWKSTDLQAWTRADGALPIHQISENRGLIVQNGSLVAVGEFGVRRSENLAQSWSELSQGIIDTSLRSLIATPDGLIGAFGDKLRTARLEADGLWHAQAMTANESADKVLTLWSGDSGQTVLAGTAESGVLISVNAGRTWTASTAGVPLYGGISGTERREIQAFAKNGPTLFAGTGAGGTWLPSVTSGGGSHSPPSSVATTGGGMIRSGNSGQSWQTVNSGFPVLGTSMFNEPIRDPILNLASPASSLPSGVVIAGMMSTGFFRTLDNGATWTSANVGLTQGQLAGSTEVQTMLTVGPAVFASLSSYAGGTLVVSRDGGASWQPRAAGLPATSAIASLAAHGQTLFAGLESPGIGAPSVYRSIDGGASWQPFGSGMDGRKVISLTVASGKLYASAEYGGVWVAPLSCLADVAQLGGAAGSDGVLSADDLVTFLSAFFAGDVSIADVSGFGGGTSDGQLTADDVIGFLAAFFAGCP